MTSLRQYSLVCDYDYHPYFSFCYTGLFIIHINKRCIKKVVIRLRTSRWHKIFWALVIALVAFSMMFGGGLHALQSVVVITSVPLILMMAMASISLIKWIKEDQARSSSIEKNDQ
ncbi:BCCT family transporter [Peribacillus simplex]|uniref:BCCT family transporter n=1 Tax=Peribacillus TaxID=2675229 RepID=UPI00315D289A